MDALRELWRDPKRRKFLIVGAGAVLVAAVWSLTRGNAGAAPAAEDPGGVWLPADPIGGGGGGGGTGDDGSWLPGDGGDALPDVTPPTDVPAVIPALLPENPASPLPASTPPVAGRLPRVTPPSSVGGVISAVGAVTPFPGFGSGSPAPARTPRITRMLPTPVTEGVSAPSIVHSVADPAPGKATNTVVTDSFKVQPGPGNTKGALAG